MIGKPSPGALINRAHPLARGLLAAWLLNEGSGRRTNDSARRRTGTLTNFTQSSTSGWRGQGLKFDGTDDHVTTGTTALANGRNAASVAMRVKFSSVSALQMIYSEDISTGTVFCLYLDNSTGKLNFYIFNGSDNFATSTTVLVANKDYDVVMSADVPSHTMRLYVNGVLEATTTSWSGSYSGSVVNTYLGRRNGAAPNYFNGFMSYCYVYGRTLTVTEARALRADPYAAWTEQPRRFYALASNYTLDAQTGEFIFNGQDAGLSVSAPTTHSAPLIPFRRYSAKINGALVTGTYEQIQALIESIAKAEAEKAAQEAIKEAKKPRRAPFLRIMPGKPIEPHIGKKVDNPLVARPLVQEYEAAYQRFLSAMIEQAIARQMADEIDDEETLLLLI